MRHCLVMWLWALLFGTAMAAEVPAVPDPSGEGPPPEAMAKPKFNAKEAQMLIAEGNLAMRESNTDPDRIVDAAFAFSQALKMYEKSGDIDRICDLQANIYWCKKRMNLDNVNRFLALKGGGKEVEEAKAILAKVDEVVNKKVPPEEAQNYFARAEKFAKENPDKYLNIAIRYCEVAERFQATEFGPKAMKLSLEAQDRHTKALQEEQLALRETLFSKPAKPSKDVKQMAVPSADNQKSAIAQLKKIYKDDYAKRKSNQKKNLVAKFMDQAQKTKDDPDLLYGLLSEAGDLALEVGDFQSVIAAIDLKAASYADIDPLAQKKAVFAKVKNNPVVNAILKLLDTPADAEANTTVGRYFCCEAGKWDLGLPMLARGSDANLKQVADMELARPAGAMQQCEIGDRWYDLAKKAKTPLKEQLLGRGLFWYQQAQPGLTGITKDKMKQRLDEIDGLLPMTNLNYDNLTPKQWERLKGTIISVSATRNRNDTNIVLKPGLRLRVVPHPTETWSFICWWDSAVTTDARGTTPSRRGFLTLGYNDENQGGMPFGSMVMIIENGAPMKAGLVEGAGRLYLAPNNVEEVGKGAIRAKIIPVSDD
jgi:hypothetical protein